MNFSLVGLFYLCYSFCLILLEVPGFYWMFATVYILLPSYFTYTVVRNIDCYYFWRCYIASSCFIFYSVLLGPFIRGKIRRVLHKTRLKWDANFPYKRHISSKVRRGLVLDKTCSCKWYSSRLIFPRINGPILIFVFLSIRKNKIKSASKFKSSLL